MPRVWKFGDSINTDDILPGKYAPFMVGEDRFHTYAFAHLRPEFAQGFRPGDLLVAGRNTGLGSSREYAPEALKRLGLRAIIGIMPFEAPQVVDALEDGDEVELEFEGGILKRGSQIFQLKPPPDFLLEALKEGSILEYYKKHGRFPGESPS